MDCSPPDSSVHGIFQARILEWLAISFSKWSSWFRDRTHVSHIADGLLHCIHIPYRMSHQGSQCLNFECISQLCHFMSVWSWVIYPTLMSISLLICTVRPLMYCGGCLPMWAILNPASQTSNSFGGDRKCSIMLVKDGVCLALLMLNRQEHFFFPSPGPATWQLQMQNSANPDWGTRTWRRLEVMVIEAAQGSPGPALPCHPALRGSLGPCPFPQPWVPAFWQLT